MFSPALSLVILFSVLPSNFIVSGVKGSRLYPFLILNVIYFLSYLHISSLMDYQYFFHAFSKYTPTNLEYLIQNSIHQVIQVYHSILEKKF